MRHTLINFSPINSVYFRHDVGCRRRDADSLNRRQQQQKKVPLCITDESNFHSVEQNKSHFFRSCTTKKLLIFHSRNL